MAYDTECKTPLNISRAAIHLALHQERLTSTALTLRPAHTKKTCVSIYNNFNSNFNNNYKSNNDNNNTKTHIKARPTQRPTNKGARNNNKSNDNNNKVGSPRTSRRRYEDVRPASFLPGSLESLQVAFYTAAGLCKSIPRRCPAPAVPDSLQPPPRVVRSGR